MRQILVVPVVLLFALGLPAAEAGPTSDTNLQPTLPPEPRTLRLAPGAGVRAHDILTIDRNGLASDIEALTRSVERVEKALGSGPGISGPGISGPGVTSGSPSHGADDEPHPGSVTAHDEKPAAPVTSEHYGPALIAVRRGGDILIDADIKDEPLDMVLKELVKISGSALEDAVVPGLKHAVNLRVRGIPWQACLDRLLGQAGLSWRMTGSGSAERIALTNAPDSDDDERAGERALERAAADGDSAFAAEARWLLANRQLKAGQPVEAMRRFNDLVLVMSRSREPAVQLWVQRSVRGIGDCMAALKQWGEARSVYRNYIARAAEGAGVAMVSIPAALITIGALVLVSTFLVAKLSRKG